MSKATTQIPSAPSRKTRGYSLMWWGIVLVFPVGAGAVLGTIHAGYDCNIESDDTVLKLLGVEWILLPMVAATLGFLAGKETLRSRGRVGRGLGAVGGMLLSLAWGAVAFWMTLLTITDAAC